VGSYFASLHVLGCMSVSLQCSELTLLDFFASMT